MSKPPARCVPAGAGLAYIATPTPTRARRPRSPPTHPGPVHPPRTMVPSSPPPLRPARRPPGSSPWAWSFHSLLLPSVGGDRHPPPPATGGVCPLGGWGERCRSSTGPSFDLEETGVPPPVGLPAARTASVRRLPRINRGRAPPPAGDVGPLPGTSPADASGSRHRHRRGGEDPPADGDGTVVQTGRVEATEGNRTLGDGTSDLERAAFVEENWQGGRIWRGLPGVATGERECWG